MTRLDALGGSNGQGILLGPKDVKRREQLRNIVALLDYVCPLRPLDIFRLIFTLKTLSHSNVSLSEIDKRVKPKAY